ncbi:hypothetical protein Ciccas_010555 [Cichlidogyrus casuarinus]|uniref:EF-hand domain-containing protein n=1 Tax=Cichlidogyrus casuarinus TaxID=1844966 RepID=A0ABD2PWR1_9PLAT
MDPSCFQTNGEIMSTRSKPLSYQRLVYPHEASLMQSCRPSIPMRLPSIQHPMLLRSVSFDNLHLTGKHQSVDTPPKHRHMNQLYKNFELPIPLEKLVACQKRSSPPPPEGILTMEGDPNKTKLPLFGTKADLGTRSSSQANSPTGSAAASSMLRFDIDEIEFTIRQKMQTHYREFRRLFVANDPESKGNLSRDALARVLTLMLHKPINQHYVSELLRRLKFRSDKQTSSTVSEATTASKLRRSASDASDIVRQLNRATQHQPRSDWLDPILRGKQPLLAHQLMALLKDRLRNKYCFAFHLAILIQFSLISIDKLLHNSEEEQELETTLIEKIELLQKIRDLGILISDSEFEKFWRRLDSSHGQAISNETFLQQLCLVNKLEHQQPHTEKEELVCDSTQTKHGEISVGGETEFIFYDTSTLINKR